MVSILAPSAWSQFYWIMDYMNVLFLTVLDHAMSKSANMSAWFIFANIRMWIIFAC